MIDFRDIFGNSKPILFLKATHKKQIFIPTHTRHDGTVVAGHYKWVHVADDHDDAKVLAGQGSHSQKVAHAKLSKQEWFNKLPDDHKAPILMAHATDHQDMDSANARVSTLTKKIIAGEKPSPSEWKAWPLVSDEKRNKALDAIEDAGKMDHFFAEHKANKESSEPSAPEAPPAAQNPEAAPQTAPQIEPAPAPAPTPYPTIHQITALHEKIDAAALPESNVNAKHFNAKLKKIKDMLLASDVGGLISESYGTNTYGKKAAALANAALEALGSTHKVAAGQKAGAHPALGSSPPVPSPKVVAATESPAPAAAAPPKPPRIVAAKTVDKNVDKPASSAQEKPGDLVVPDFEEGKTTTGVKAYYEKAAQKIIGMAAAGDVSGLESMPNPDKGQTWKGKTANSKKMIALHAAALAAAKGGSTASAPDEYEVSKLSEAELQSARMPDNAISAAAQEAALQGDVEGVKKQMQSAMGAGEQETEHAIDKLLHMMKDKQTKTTFTMKMGESVASGPKEGDTKPAADGGTLVLKDGHWIKQGGDDGAPVPPVIEDISDVQQVYLQSGIDALASGDLASVKTKLGFVKHVTDPEWQKVKAFLEQVEAHVEKNGGAQSVDLTPPKPAAKVVLDMNEIPPKPDGASSSHYGKAAGLAADGDLAGLKKMYTQLVADSYAMTHPVVKQMINQLEAKQAGPGVASKGLLHSEFPPIHVSVLKQIAQTASKLAEAGELEALKSYYKQLPSSAPESKKWVEKVISTLDAKQNGVPSTKPQVVADDGPKDGDTKQGADGMLIFKDGRWHKQHTDPKEMKKKAASVGMPVLSGKYSINMKKTMKAIKHVAETEGAAGLAKYLKIQTDGKIKINTIGGAKGWAAINENHGNANAAKMAKYAFDMLDAMEGTSGPGAPAIVGATVKNQASSGPAAPPTPMPTVKTQTEKVGEITALVADKWEQTGPQGGSNPGGRFKDQNGQEWYCKFPPEENVVKNELLAAKFYEMLGAKVPSLRLVKKDGKLGIASKWVDGIKKVDAGALAAAEGAHTGFVFDAWLANWDVVGLSNDNLLLDKDGKAMRVDVGGSLVYRAMGGKKGDAFGDEVPELDTLKDEAKNNKSGAVFKGITPADLYAGGKQLAKLKPSQIDELVMKAAPGDESDKLALAQKLKARRTFILSKLGIKDQWDKAPVDETKVRVDPDDIPHGIDFFHHPEKNGGPVSSKEQVNKQNTIDSQALADFAKKGDLKALKDYHYDAYDKETGKYIGKKPITQHPSNHIQKQWASLVQTLQSVAYPPAETLDMPSFGFGGTLDEVAKEVGAFAPHENVTTVPAEHRFGYFMKLAQVDADIVQEYLSEKKWHFAKTGDAFDQSGKMHYKQCSQTVKNYVSGVQGSGSINHIWSQGHTTGGGMPINQFTKKIYDEAQEIPGGTQLWRWMDDDTAGDIMTKQLINAAPGTVLQNTDSMCASFKEGWGATDNPHFCSEPKKAILMRIRCADGAKATPSHGSGVYQSEAEITTLPGARFMVVSVTKGDHRHPNGILVDCIMLPPDEGFVAQLAK